MNEENKDKDFKVVDKRSFHIKEDGSVESRGQSGRTEPVSPGTGPPGQQPPQGKGPQPPQQITFTHVILSLSASAYSFLEKEKNPEQAKYMIDALGVLQGKTQGNLTKDEEELLKNVLFDLRMKYVQGLKK